MLPSVSNVQVEPVVVNIDKLDLVLVEKDDSENLSSPSSNVSSPSSTKSSGYGYADKVRSVDVKEALRLQKENNFVILDVRPEAEYKEAHPPGAVNVQIYRLIKEWTAWDIARCATFAFFGIFAGTEENHEFLQSVETKLGKDANIIVACSTGGTMKPT